MLTLPQGQQAASGTTLPTPQVATQQASQTTTTTTPQIAVQKQPTSILVSSPSSTPQLVISSNQSNLTSPSRVLIPSGQVNASGISTTPTGVVIARPAAQVRPAGQVMVVSQPGTPQIALAGSPTKALTVARPQTPVTAKIGGTPVVLSQGAAGTVVSVAASTPGGSSTIRQVIMANQSTPIKVSAAPGTVLNASTAAALLQVSNWCRV